MSNQSTFASLSSLHKPEKRVNKTSEKILVFYWLQCKMYGYKLNVVLLALLFSELVAFHSNQVNHPKTFNKTLQDIQLKSPQTIASVRSRAYVAIIIIEIKNMSN